jgi:tetratricopeptide (TPR) repeat protein
VSGFPVLLLWSIVYVSQSSTGAPNSDAASFSEMMRQAENALSQHQYKEAEVFLKHLIAANPKASGDAHVLYDLGFAEERNDEDAEAAKSYALAFVADKSFAEPQLALGLLDARRGLTESAQRELQIVADMTSASAEDRGTALRALARLDENDDPAAASEELLEALKLTPETPDDVLLAAALAEHSADWPNAEIIYRRLWVSRAADPEVVAGLANALHQQKKDAEAEAVLAAGIKDSPHDPRLVVQAASVYAANGKVADAIKAIETLRAADAVTGSNPSILRMLARLTALNGDNTKAEILYTQLVKANPNDPLLLDDLGSLQVKMLDYSEAEKTLGQAVQLRQSFADDPTWAEVAAHLAFAASKNNDPQTTLRALQLRGTILPNSPSSLFLEATAHDSLKQTKEAVNAYHAFLAMANGKYPDQEFEARHRLIALEHTGSR